MVPCITLSGTPIEMGTAFGEEFKEKINEFAETRLVRLKQFIKDNCQTAITDAELFSKVTALNQYHKAYDSELWEEFCGIAKAANISHEMLTIAMGYTDLRDYLAQNIVSDIKDVGGCSAFIIPKEFSQQGVLCGQTWDMSVEAFNYLVLVHRKPKTGPQTLYLTTMGCLGLIGFNDRGIAVGNTNLMSTDNQPGVNYLFTISRALNMASLDAAVGSIVNTPRLAGHNFYVANSTQAINIEATARLAYCSIIENQPHVQTNHYLNQSLSVLEKELPKNIYQHTHYRFGRMTNHFVKSEKIWDVEAAWKALADDKRNELGAAICNEDYAGKYGDFATVASAVLVPQEKMMWVCSKGTKSGQIQKVSL